MSHQHVSPRVVGSEAERTRTRGRWGRRTYNGEDVRCLVRHVVEILAVLGVLDVPVDDVLGHALELLRGERDRPLSVKR